MMQMNALNRIHFRNYPACRDNPPLSCISLICMMFLSIPKEKKIIILYHINKLHNK